MNPIIFEFTVENTPIRENKDSTAVALSSEKISFKSGSIWPDFYPETVLLVFMPLAFVLRPIDMSIFAKPLCLIIHPLPLVKTPITMDQPSTPVSHIVFPISGEGGSIFPLLRAFAFSEPVMVPSPNIYGTIIKFKRTSFYEIFNVLHDFVVLEGA